MQRFYKAYKDCKVRVTYDFQTGLFIIWLRTAGGDTDSTSCLVNIAVCVVLMEETGNGHHHMTPTFVAVRYGKL